MGPHPRFALFLKVYLWGSQKPVQNSHYSLLFINEFIRNDVKSEMGRQSFQPCPTLLTKIASALNIQAMSLS